MLGVLSQQYLLYLTITNLKTTIMNNMTIKEFIERFDRFEFSDPDTLVQIKAGWDDWFCNDKSLCNKTKILGKKVKQIASSPKINVNTMYVLFKNNCPCNGPLYDSLSILRMKGKVVGPLYDSFSICDMESHDVLFWVTPKSGHTGKAEVVAAPNFGENVVEGTWKDVKEYFLK